VHCSFFEPIKRTDTSPSNTTDWRDKKCRSIQFELTKQRRQAIYHDPAVIFYSHCDGEKKPPRWQVQF
jgi:hypothetical protein